MRDARTSRLVEDFQQPAGVPPCRGAGAPQRRHASRPRRQEGLEEAAGDREADPLGLGHAGHFGLLLRGDLDGTPQALLKLVHLASELSDLLLQFGDPGLGRGAVDRVDDLRGLAIERLP